jgi:hypothetical protein
VSIQSAVVLIGIFENVERGNCVQAGCRFKTEGLSSIVIGEIGREVSRDKDIRMEAT